MNPEEKAIKDYMNKTIPTFSVDIDMINTYFNYTYDFFCSCSMEELGQIVFDLKKYSMWLKIENNKQDARSRWLHMVLLKGAKPHAATNYNSYDKDERFYSAIKDNDKFSEYFKTKEACNAKTNTIKDLNKQVDSLVYTLENILNAKIRNLKEKNNE